MQDRCARPSRRAGYNPEVQPEYIRLRYTLEFNYFSTLFLNPRLVEIPTYEVEKWRIIG